MLMNIPMGSIIMANKPKTFVNNNWAFFITINIFKFSMVELTINFKYLYL